MDGIFRYWRIFLKFMLDLDAQKYMGVDVTNLFPEDISMNQGFFSLVQVCNVI